MKSYGPELFLSSSVKKAVVTFLYRLRNSLTVIVLLGSLPFAYGDNYPVSKDDSLKIYKEQANPPFKSRIYVSRFDAVSGLAWPGGGKEGALIHDLGEGWLPTHVAVSKRANASKKIHANASKKIHANANKKIHANANKKIHANANKKIHANANKKIHVCGTVLPAQKNKFPNNLFIVDIKDDGTLSGSSIISLGDDALHNPITTGCIAKFESGKVVVFMTGNVRSGKKSEVGYPFVLKLVDLQLDHTFGDEGVIILRNLENHSSSGVSVDDLGNVYLAVSKSKTVAILELDKNGVLPVDANDGSQVDIKATPVGKDSIIMLSDGDFFLGLNEKQGVIAKVRRNFQFSKKFNGTGVFREPGADNGGVLTSLGLKTPDELFSLWKLDSSSARILKLDANGRKDSGFSGQGVRKLVLDKPGSLLGAVSTSSHVYTTGYFENSHAHDPLKPFMIYYVSTNGNTKNSKSVEEYFNSGGSKLANSSIAHVSVQAIATDQDSVVVAGFMLINQ